MGQWNRHLKRITIGGGLEAAWLANAAGLMREARGRGVIFTLHHVRPHIAKPFEPNQHLEITPDFLDAALRRLKRSGYRFVPLDAVPSLLSDSQEDRLFAAFTLDDGYRNNLVHAVPVFERHGAPFTVFVTQGFAERSHSIWWETLALLLGRENSIEFNFGGERERVALDTPVRKWHAFDRFAEFIHRHDESRAISEVDALARRHGIEPLDITRELVMGPEELLKLSTNPLASLGAHTISHRALARLPQAEARIEMEISADYVESITGIRPRTIAYPYGTPEATTGREAVIAADLGFTIAVTTQPGFPAASKPTHMPRISLNGFYQKPRYVSALASGIPLKLLRK
ncbi:peptidoglycan/xylan/chitin deacetylase (PgdA/CDA1 family) [Rhizobium sp. BK650]|uniref:polysaccharide deacetylase family protein n=1 Tax=Rhizobium sp. BK650 TaxID=2586990 RepID=UPI001622C5C2|nr:polysaccharide deacetylase family protein [Rhizobium sp. BK650]MBB3659521.1 peptidoglycan/xylan/chitin deacetylase (PgdA/CDA1 family) [Rhizobium sp. BK650]